tara:strand:+ start:817 stop:1062 length:246 start_codon:yes stop_codon:yes gene_type:complete
MFKIELNKKKLDVVSSSLQMLGTNINLEIHSQTALLRKLDQLNLSNGDTGLMDFQIEEKKSLVKFLESQQELVQKLIILTK